MNHFFGKNFRQQRKKQDWTQEQIADMLGISSQAVSKWENGTSLPDISLLPIIANLFHVSIDRLLGIDISKREERILDILTRAEELCSQKRYIDAVSFLRDALLQYPAEPRILYQLAWNLTGTIKENPQNLAEAISLYERILELCEEPALRFKTIRDLMYRYLSAQDEDQARKTADMLPDFAVCKEYNLGRSNLLGGRELAEYLQKNIQLYGNAMKECLEYFLDTAILSEEDMLPYSVNIAKKKMELLNQILEV